MASLHLNNMGNLNEIQEGYTEPSRHLDQLMVENGNATTPYHKFSSFQSKFSVPTTCEICNLRVTTNVDKQLCTQGWSWVICCCLACFGGGWFLGLLVLCVDTFWKFDHYCPRCSNKIGTYSPKASCRITTLLILIVFAVIALNVFLAWYFGGLIISYITARKMRYELYGEYV